MRGEDRRTGRLFSYVDLETRVPADHPLRAIRDLVDAALAALSADFDTLYSRVGRPSIAPERLLRALLLQCFYSVRSERQLMERLDFDLLFRWFVGLGVDDPVWDASVFSKNRDRLLAGEVAQRFLAELVALPEVRATARGTSRARSARTRPMPAPPTRTRASTARATASGRSSATSGTR